MATHATTTTQIPTRLSATKLDKLSHIELVKHSAFFQKHDENMEKANLKLEKKIKQLTEKLEKEKEKKQAKQAKKKSAPPCHSVPIEAQIQEIANLALAIRKRFPYSGKENHFQAAMEMELRNKGYIVSQELARLLHYQPLNSCQQARQLPHDIRCREDLTIPNLKLVLELKQVKSLGVPEHQQLMRYMRERYTYEPDWGAQTQGLLINFGDEDVEVVYMFYPPTVPPENTVAIAEPIEIREPEIVRVRILKEPIPHLDDISRQFIAA